MFSVVNNSEDGFDKIVLREEASGTFAEIIPSCGAILHSFSVLFEFQMLNLIWNYQDYEDFKKNVTAKGFRSCKLSPFACRISDASYKFGEGAYKIEKFKLNGSALHGLIYDAVFFIKAWEANEEKAAVTLEHQYRGVENGYPFHYDCEVIYELRKGDSLNIKTTIINKDKGLIPIQDGWHPYFTFGGMIDVLQLEFQSKEIVAFTEALVPTGELIPYPEFNALKKIGDTKFDNCFTLNFASCQPLCILRDPEKKLQLEIFPDKSYPYLQIYTPTDRNSIAIENLSAAPDAFNNGMGLIVLSPGSSAVFSTTYKISSII